MARAQSSAALEHYHDGESLYERGTLAEALKQFERAYAIDPQPHRGERVGMHFEDYDPEFQMGRIHARLGHFAEAKRLFDRCAARGYTQRSENAEEFRRWRSIVEQAVATVLPAPSPVPIATVPEAVATRAAPAETVIPIPTRPETVVSVVAGRKPTVPLGEEATREASLWATAAAGVVTTTPALAIAGQTTPTTATFPEAAGAPGDRRPTAAQTPSSGLTPSTTAWTLSEPIRREFLLGGLLALALVAAWRVRRRRSHRLEEGTVPFGRFSITGLLGVGRSSFVYDAKDRKTGQTVALRIRRPDSGPTDEERFGSEGSALERLKHVDGAEVPVAKLLGRGIQKVSRRPLEYLALERLSGRTLLDLSRNARPRLDLTLCVEILREIAGALGRIRTVGLSYAALDLEDIFLVDPVPVNAGNAIRLKVFGLCPGPGNPARDAAALAAIAATLFQSRAVRWEEDEWVAQRVPAGLRQVLVRVRDTPGAPGTSFEDLEKALQESTGGHSRESRSGSSAGA